MSKNIKRIEDSSLSLSFALEAAANFLILTKNRYINSIWREPLYNDEPKLFAYSASYANKNNSSENIASGISFNKERASIRVVGEALERYCLDNFDERNLVVSNVLHLSAPFLDSACVISFSRHQLKKKPFRKFIIKNKSSFGWIEGYSLSLKKKVLVPAQLVFTTYQTLKDEPWIRLPISTGAATGISLESAIYRGICEVVERDAFMISYLNKLHSPVPVIDLNSIKDGDIAHILNVFNRYRLELVVIDLTTDIQIPAFAAIVLDKTGGGPAVSIGLKAGFNTKNVIVGAIEESLMVRSWLRDRFIYTNTIHKMPKVIRTIEDRAYFWFKPEAIRYLDFWLKHRKIKRPSFSNQLSAKHGKFQQAINLLQKAGMDIFYVDITHPKMKKFGFIVAKVIIPQLHPLYLDEKYPYLGGNRLYKTPVKMGFFRKPKNEEELNKIPHPFL